MELGEVLMPALTPLAWQHQDDSVRLGRVSDWVRLDSGAEVPAGQKLLIMDDEEIPILEAEGSPDRPACHFRLGR